MVGLVQELVLDFIETAAGPEAVARAPGEGSRLRVTVIAGPLDGLKMLDDRAARDGRRDEARSRHA